MELITHIVTFAAAIVAIWFFAGLIVDSVDKIAKRFHNSSFVVAFFLLGFLTSLGEISVAINSVLNGVPQVAAGNLVGASFVLLLFVVPLLAVAANGVKMNKVFDGWRLVYVLLVAALPSLFLIDGSVSPREGVATILFLVSLFWVVRKHTVPAQTAEKIILAHKRSPLWDVGKVIISAVVIFFSGHLLVGESVYFATVLNAPKSMVGMILLSLGTNIPEISIAMRAVLKKRSEVALGNYLGSATMNVATFAAVSLLAGKFVVVQSEFVISFVFTFVGFILFYFFIKSREVLSRKEGIILLLFYVAFLVVHVVSVVQDVPL